MTFCGSSGLRILAEARRAARTAGAIFRIAAATSPLLRVLELVGALVVFEVYPDVPGARRAADSEPTPAAAPGSPCCRS